MNMLIHLLLTSGYFRLVYPMFRYFASKTVGFLSVWSWVGKLISWLYFSEIQHCHCASCKVEKTQKGRTVFQAGVFKCEPLLIFMILVSGWAPKPDLGKKSILTHFPTSLKTLKMTKLPNFPLFLGSSINQAKSNLPGGSSQCPVPAGGLTMMSGT